MRYHRGRSSAELYLGEDPHSFADRNRGLLVQHSWIINLVSVSPRNTRKHHPVLASSDRLRRHRHKMQRPAKKSPLWQTTIPFHRDVPAGTIINRTSEKYCPKDDPSRIDQIEGVATCINAQLDGPQRPSLVGTPIPKLERRNDGIRLSWTQIPSEICFSRRRYNRAPLDMNILSDGSREDFFSDISDLSLDNDRSHTSIFKNQPKHGIEHKLVNSSEGTVKPKDGATELLRCLPLSSHHRKPGTVTHDPTWGITTIQLNDQDEYECRDDDIWPSDEEDEMEKRYCHHHYFKEPSLHTKNVADDRQKDSNFPCHWPNIDLVPGLTIEGNSSPLSIPSIDSTDLVNVPDNKSSPESSGTVTTADTTTWSVTPRVEKSVWKCQSKQVLNNTWRFEEQISSPAYTTISTTEASSLDMDGSHASFDKNH